MASQELKDTLPSFQHHELDIRDRSKVLALVKEITPDAIVHTAAQPSHDKAASIPFDDFDVNAVGTLNLLEACRQDCPDTPFVHMSTNKVYGDGPNSINLKELESRWEYDDPFFKNGIQKLFLLINVSTRYSVLLRLPQMLWCKNTADILEWPHVVRGGCLTGPSHSGVELHGFLSYLVKCNIEKELTKYLVTKENRYATIFILKMLHDLSNVFCRLRDQERFIIWEVEKANSCSILEAFEICEGFQAKNKNMNIWMKTVLGIISATTVT